MEPDTLKEELRALLNRHSRENASNTPDFILAEFMLTCLAAFEHSTRERETWYGRTPRQQVTPEALSGSWPVAGSSFESVWRDDCAAKQIEQPLNSAPGQGGPG